MTRGSQAKALEARLRNNVTCRSLWGHQKQRWCLFLKKNFFKKQRAYKSKSMSSIRKVLYKNGRVKAGNNFPFFYLPKPLLDLSTPLISMCQRFSRERSVDDVLRVLGKSPGRQTGRPTPVQYKEGFSKSLSDPSYGMQGKVPQQVASTSALVVCEQVGGSTEKTCHCTRCFRSRCVLTQGLEGTMNKQIIVR